MECLAGVGLATGAATVASSAQQAFDYNRTNFQADRAQRRRMATHTMKWRVQQASQWREDVRDLISLTEYKMRLYLIVNVLLLGMTIFLWTEGSLPRTSPHWLMVGSSISIGSSFNFLILSIWLAMYAAISAQSFEARILTQLVRLPIPTWEELEATRTYGSEFEKLEARQMFRVPYVMGWQEKLVGDQHSNEGTPSASAGGSHAASAPASDDGVAVDPWGLEEGNQGLPELGCGLGSDVAKLWHVKLCRQTAMQWQMYDAFARICMSVGVQQLMLAMTYFVIGYLFVEVRCKGPALSGVVGFTIIAEMILNFDMSLPRKAGRVAQFLLAVGPLCACMAAYEWAESESEGYIVWVIIAFLSHGLYFGFLAYLCQIKELKSGAWLPQAFRAVLYLDAFGWLRGRGEKPVNARPQLGFLHSVSTLFRQASTTTVGSDEPNVMAHTSALDESEAGRFVVGRPGVQTIIYNEKGLPVPVRAQDWAPPVLQDLRSLPGAPEIARPLGEMHPNSQAFYDNQSFLPAAEGDSEEKPAADEDDWQTNPMGYWSSKLGAGDLPWKTFMTAMMVLCLVWILSAGYALHGSLTNWSLDINVKQPSRNRTNKHGKHYVAPDSFQPWVPDVSNEWQYKDLPWWIKEELNRTSKKASFVSLDTGKQASHGTHSDVLSKHGTANHQPTSASVVPEQVLLQWPHRNIMPNRISCDASGRHFVFSDRILLLSASLSSRETGSSKHKSLHMAPQELVCSKLLGEGLEDVAVSCNSTLIDRTPKCSVLALHRNGRLLTYCPLSEAADTSLIEASGADQQDSMSQISERWLENYHSNGAARGGGVRTRIEKPLSLSMNPACKHPATLSKWSCTLVGTSHGRVVQLGRRSNGNDLIPTDIIHEENGYGQTGRSEGHVRAFNKRFVGILQSERNVIRVLDLSKGGLLAGSVEIPVRKPVIAFCAGGGKIFLLTRGAAPQLWSIPIPDDFMVDV